MTRSRLIIFPVEIDRQLTSQSQKQLYKHHFEGIYNSLTTNTTSVDVTQPFEDEMTHKHVAIVRQSWLKIS